MILDIPNPRNLQKTLLELMKEFSKVIGHEINTHRSVVFLCYQSTIWKGRKQYHLQ